MKRLHCWAAVLAVAAVVAPGARADDASKAAKVQQLLTVMRTERSAAQMKDSVSAQIQRMIQGMPGMNNLTAEQKRIADDFQKRALGAVAETITWKSMEPDYEKAYSSVFTEAEIDGLLAFYKSPTGQALLTKGQDLGGKEIQIGQARMAILQPRLKAMNDDFARQMMAAAPPRPTTPAKPSAASKAPAK